MLNYPGEGSSELPENRIYSEFSRRADKYVAQMLNDYVPEKYRDIKAIHDPVWGSIKFYPWELQLIDSPPLQRLRNINQLGLAVLTYPSAHHSRFEHTLGVISLVTKMANSLNGSYDPDNYCMNKRYLSDDDINRLRLAAILHDIGHCFFSHLSERMYGNTKEFIELKSSFDIFSAAKPHEILGYIIINTPSFVNFFDESVDFPPNSSDESTGNGSMLADIGRMIVGAPVDTLVPDGDRYFRKYYLTEMINGEFDADSLDYLRRDSYVTGLSMTYHIDRFLYKIRIVDKEEFSDGQRFIGRHLTVSSSGVSTVEEMIFGKQMLTRYIYQHQKVLASDVLVYDIVNGLRNSGKLTHPCDFLYYCDDDIYKIYDESGDPDFRIPVYDMPINPESQKTISDVVKQIRMRSLPKMALAVNMSNLLSVGGKTNFTLDEAYEFLNNAINNSGFRKAVRDKAEEINKKTGQNCKMVDLFDIFFAIPKPITARGFSDAYVTTRDGEFYELMQMGDLDEWANEFSARAWNAYIYTAEEHLPLIAIAAKEVLNDRKIEFREDRLYSGLKKNREIEEILQKL